MQLEARWHRTPSRSIQCEATPHRFWVRETGRPRRRRRKASSGEIRIQGDDVLVAAAPPFPGGRRAETLMMKLEASSEPVATALEASPWATLIHAYFKARIPAMQMPAVEITSIGFPFSSRGPWKRGRHQLVRVAVPQQRSRSGRAKSRDTAGAIHGFGGHLCVGVRGPSRLRSKA